MSDTGDPWYSHPLLFVLSSLLAQVPVIPNAYPAVPINEAYRPFQANDGMVPLTSALLLKPGSGTLFTVVEGLLVYNPDHLKEKCQLDECNVIDFFLTDHLAFLDADFVIAVYLDKLKALCE